MSLRFRVYNGDRTIGVVAHESLFPLGAIAVDPQSGEITAGQSRFCCHPCQKACWLHVQQQLGRFIRELLVQGTKTGDVREDVAPDELATYCLHALAAASSLRSKAAVRRLVTVTLAGLRP
jgi:hypothetical protein